MDTEPALSTSRQAWRDHGELPASAPVVVIGGGIVGISTAFFLARNGIEAIVLEGEPGLGARTTAMSAHCIRAQFGEPDNIAMMAESLAFYEQFTEHCRVDHPDGISLCQQGYLFASTDPDDRAPFSQRVARQREAGLDDVELLVGTEVRSRFPWLSDDIAIATWRARDGWIDSAAAVQAMAASSGQRIYTNVTVSGIDVSNGRVVGVTTDAGRVATETVVLAAGPWSRNLAPEPLPVVLWRRHRLIVPPHPEIPQSGPVMIDANTGAHWRPHKGGALIAWAQPETDSPRSWPVPTDPAFIEQVLHGPDGIGRLAPFWYSLAKRLDPSTFLLTAGQYTVTPDHRPLIGADERVPGLYLHTGYSGHGIMGAPAGARILADVLAARVSDNPFSPSRFSEGAVAPDMERVII